MADDIHEVAVGVECDLEDGDGSGTECGAEPEIGPEVQPRRIPTYP